MDQLMITSHQQYDSLLESFAPLELSVVLNPNDKHVAPTELDFLYDLCSRLYALNFSFRSSGAVCFI